MYLFAIHISSLGKCFDKCFAHFSLSFRFFPMKFCELIMYDLYKSLVRYVIGTHFLYVHVLPFHSFNTVFLRKVVFVLVNSIFKTFGFFFYRSYFCSAGLMVINSSEFVYLKKCLFLFHFWSYFSCIWYSRLTVFFFQCFKCHSSVIWLM